MSDLMKQLVKSSSSFLTAKPKSYYQYALINDKIGGKFFFQVAATVNDYDLDLRVRIYSENTELVSTESSVTSVMSGKEAVRHEHVCEIRPNEGKTSCTYYLTTKKVTDVKVKLTKWSYVKTEIDSDENLPVF